MNFEIPPATEKYKLVATFEHEGDTYLAMLTKDAAFNVKWDEVPTLEDEELKEYLLSMSTEIEQGIYDISLLDD